MTSDNRPDSLGMKLHSPTGEDGIRVAEFWTDAGSGFQISVIDDAHQDEPTVRTVNLVRREAEALRHWLDAALMGTPSVSRREWEKRKRDGLVNQ